MHSSKLLLLDNLSPGVSLPATRGPAVPCSLGGSSGGCSRPPTAPASEFDSKGLFPPLSTWPRLSFSVPPASKLLLQQC